MIFFFLFTLIGFIDHFLFEMTWLWVSLKLLLVSERAASDPTQTHFFLFVFWSQLNLLPFNLFVRTSNSLESIYRELWPLFVVLTSWKSITALPSVFFLRLHLQGVVKSWSFSYTGPTYTLIWVITALWKVAFRSFMFFRPMCGSARCTATLMKKKYFL